MSEKAAASQLRQFVERVERLDEEIAGLNADKKDLFAEARASGFDVKALKSVLGIRRKDPGERAEHNAVVALYLSTLGMADAAEEVEHNDPRVHVQAHDAPVREAQAAAPAVTLPVAQHEGRPDNAGKALDDVPEQGVGEDKDTGQSEEFVTAPEVGEGVPTRIEPASEPERTSTPAIAPAPSLPPERAARLADFEARQRASFPPLDPKHPLFPIRFKARHGRDPDEADIAALATAPEPSRVTA